MNEDELKTYEISFLAKEERGREDMLRLLKKYGAEVSSDGATQRIKLAYPIKKEQFGHFGCIYFSVNPGAIEGVKDGLKINPQILRFSIGRSFRLKEEDDKRPFSRQTRRSAYARENTRSENPPDALVKKDERGVLRQGESRARRPAQGELSNEALEKKLEEILK